MNVSPHKAKTHNPDTVTPKGSTEDRFRPGSSLECRQR